MPPSKRTLANQANAQRSTGPRTAAGKARSRDNSVKHGLAIPVAALPELAPELAALARRFAGDGAGNPALLQAATRVAEAVFDLQRVRQAQANLLNRILRATTELEKEAPCPEAVPLRPQPLQISYADRVRASQDGTTQDLLDREVAHMWEQIRYESAVERIRQHQADAREQAKDLASDWGQLDKLERYERRALSRRNTTMKALDALRQT